MSCYKLFSDYELVNLLREDDHGAFTEIYTRYADVVYRNTYQLLKDRFEVMDIVQEVFTCLWNKRSEVIINSNLAGYLYVAARNSVFKKLSHQEVESKYINFIEFHAQDSFTGSDHLIREKQLQSIIDQEIDGLPTKMREVLNLSRKSYLTHKEIGHALHISEGTVKKQVNNALKILRVKLATYGSLFFLVLAQLLT
jgi:RNA polymerase sigma-70 factor (family 1)